MIWPAPSGAFSRQPRQPSTVQWAVSVKEPCTHRRRLLWEPTQTTLERSHKKSSNNPSPTAPPQSKPNRQQPNKQLQPPKKPSAMQLMKNKRLKGFSHAVSGVGCVAQTSDTTHQTAPERSADIKTMLLTPTQWVATPIGTSAGASTITPIPAASTKGSVTTHVKNDSVGARMKQ